MHRSHLFNHIQTCLNWLTKTSILPLPDKEKSRPAFSFNSILFGKGFEERKRLRWLGLVEESLIYWLLQHTSCAVYRIRKLHFRLRLWRSQDSSVSLGFNAERHIFVSFVSWSIRNSIAPSQSWANSFWNERRGCEPARSKQKHLILQDYAKMKVVAYCLMLLCASLSYSKPAVYGDTALSQLYRHNLQ